MRLIVKFNILRLIVVFFAMAAVGIMQSETVSQKQAKKIAEMFFNEARGLRMSAPEYVYNGKNLSTGRFMTPFYVYNHSSGGFVVISAENKSFPILAYDLDNKFDTNNIGEQRLALLSLYAKHIEYIRYDSSIPESAIKAWQNLPQYIYDMLNAEEVLSPISRKSIIDVRNELDLLLMSDENSINSQMSSTYYPSQWSELVSDELSCSNIVSLGLIDKNEIEPIVVYGRKGDMYRLAMDGKELGWYRLMPTEIMSFGQIALLENTPNSIEEYTEEEPFSYYKSYVAEFETERRRKQSDIENANIVTSPIIRNNGGGHYMIDMPEDISMVRVFNLSGGLVWHATYNLVCSVPINLASVPTGFYFAVLLSETGQTYSVKLFR